MLPTPEICCRRCLTWFLAIFVSSAGGSSPASATETTGAAPVSNFCTTGGSMPCGRLRSIAAILSRTSCIAWSPSTSSSNWITTCVTLSRLREVMRLTPVSDCSASSIGSATFCSIVSGSAPG